MIQNVKPRENFEPSSPKTQNTIHKNHTTGTSIKTNLQLKFQSYKGIAKPE